MSTSPDSHLRISASGASVTLRAYPQAGSAEPTKFERTCAGRRTLARIHARRAGQKPS